MQWRITLRQSALRLLSPAGCTDVGGQMSDTGNPGYLPGDPRYGLYGDALKDYYRKKAAQWAIYCWDKGERSDAVLRTAMRGGDTT
jgi:hypothetical protein